MVKGSQNIFRQIFEELVTVKISPRQNFMLYGIRIRCHGLTGFISTLIL